LLDQRGRLTRVIRKRPRAPTCCVVSDLGATGGRMERLK
jgi:hypothetical protein